MVVGLAYADRRIRNLTGFLTLCIFQYLIALSSAQTKLAWYESPLFPLLAIVTAIFLSWIFNALQQQLFKYQLISPVAGFIVLFLFFVKPYTTIFSSVYENTKISMAERINEVPAYLKYAIESGINIDGSKIIYNDYYSSILCYQRMLDDRGMHATLASVTDLQPGDKVISSEPEVFSAMENKFNVELLREFYDVRVYHLSSLK